jgi:pyridoxamine 5'-phosphate oxidase
MINIADIRKEYALKKFDTHHAHPNPFEQFNNWFQEALNAELPEPTAMHLATVSPAGKPSGRIVLLKGVDTGFVFYTNYDSRKGKDLINNPYAAITFFWAELERQVRIEGRIEKVKSELSDEYFRSRPLESQYGALASPQSQVVENRDVLERIYQEVLQKFDGQQPPRPDNWGGFRVLPEVFEFWQGRKSRLHDRLRYKIAADDHWKIERLAP